MGPRRIGTQRSKLLDDETGRFERSASSTFRYHRVTIFSMQEETLEDAARSHSEPRQTRASQSRIPLLLLVLVTAVVYSNTLRNGYHLDSLFRVANNTEIERFWPPSRFFTDPRTGSADLQLAEYRPLMPVSHSVDVAVSKMVGVDRLVIFHLGNILLHIASTLLLFLLFRDLLRFWSRAGVAETWSRNLALGASLVFAVHPVSGTAVNYLAARDLLLMMMFTTAALLTYVRMRRGGDSLIGWSATLALVTLALLSKANAVVFFALVALFELLLARTRWSDWRLWARVAPTLALSLGFLYFNSRLLFPAVAAAALPVSPQVSPRSAAVMPPSPTSVVASGRSNGASIALAQQRQRRPQGQKPTARQSPRRQSVRAGEYVLLDRETYIMTMAKMHLFYYARNFVWPFHMRPLPRVEVVESPTDWQAILGAGFIGATLVLALTLRRRSPLAAFCIFSYWALFSVTGSVFPLQEVVRDYRQYPSLPFLCLVLALASTLLPERLFSSRGRIVTILAVVATLYFGASTYAANRWWRTEETFWKRSTRLGGEALAHVNLGQALIESDPEGAAEQFERAIKIEPGNIYAHINLGMLYVSGGQVEEGLALLRWVVSMGPDWAVGHYYLAEGLRRAGRDQEALGPAQRAAELNRYSIEYQYKAARALQVAGRIEESLPYLRRLTELNADYLDTQFLLGWAMQERGDLERAATAYRRLLRKNPDHQATRLNLGIALMKLGSCEEAVEHFERVLAADPGSTWARRHLDTCRLELSNSREAAKP